LLSDESKERESAESEDEEAPPVHIPISAEEIVVVHFDEKHLIKETQHSKVYYGKTNLQSLGLETDVAIKLWQLPTRKQDQIRVQEQFDKEVRALRILASPFNVHFVSFCRKITIGPIHFACLVMEKCEQNLSQYLIDHEKELLENYQIRSMFVQLAFAYQFLHRSPNPISHRDVKPENILVKGKPYGDGGPTLKLCDFAFSKCLSEYRSQSSICMSTFVGTVNESGCWIAPEVKEEKREGEGYGLAADIWSLGCVFYFIATQGRVLFKSTAERDDFGRRLQYLETYQVNDKLVYALKYDLIEKMTRPNFSDRIDIADIVNHPALWKPEFVCSFLSETYEHWEKNEVRS
jgi:serine/threonine protein kinase